MRLLADSGKPELRLLANDLYESGGVARVASHCQSFVRFLFGRLQQEPVANQVPHTKRRNARLARAHHLTRSANLQVFFSNLEAVAGFLHNREPFSRLRRALVRSQKYAISLLASSPDPPPQLMQL